MPDFDFLADDRQEPEFTRFKIGDALGHDEHLRDFLQYLDERANNDAPGTARYRTRDLLGLVSSPLMTVVALGRRATELVIERFTTKELRKAKASDIRANAAIKRAKARAIAKKTAADVTFRLAEAESIQTEAQMTKLKQLKELGIDWRSEIGTDGIERIVVTKQTDDFTR